MEDATAARGLSHLPQPPAWLLAPLAGILITLSLAPFSIWPAGIAGCALYLGLLSRCNSRSALWRGWLFGVGLFGSGVSWVYVSIHVYGNASMALAGFMTLAFCLALALLHAAFAWTYVRFVRLLPGGMLIGFAALWVLFEWLRSWLLTGFPWLYLGYGLIDTPLAGWAPVTGVFGLSLAGAFTAACLLLAWRRRRLQQGLIYAAMIAALWGAGAWLKNAQWVAPADASPLNVVIYQPDIPLEHKWDRNRHAAIQAQFRRDTEPLLRHDLIVWPEAALPGLLGNNRRFIESLADKAQRNGNALLLGTLSRSDDGRRYFNSATVFGAGSGLYHKQHLVPFGEYVPLERWLRGLIDFFDLPMSVLSPGPAGQPPLEVQGYRVAPLICYEITFPDQTARAADGAEILLTLSNDTWFGRSIGPLQHLQMARMRALENGRYLIRGTNNGVSAIIDNRGRIRARSPQFVTTAIAGEVPPLMGSTPFTRLGSTPVLIACAAALLSAWVFFVTLWRRPEKED